jgi:hypothetical protein
MVSAKGKASFRIDDSFAISSIGFVFAGEILQGTVSAGMQFLVYECGHHWRVVVRSVEFLRGVGGTEKIALVVENPTPGYLKGLGIGQTVELSSPEGIAAST